MDCGAFLIVFSLFSKGERIISFLSRTVTVYLFILPPYGNFKTFHKTPGPTAATQKEQEPKTDKNRKEKKRENAGGNTQKSGQISLPAVWIE